MDLILKPIIDFVIEQGGTLGVIATMALLALIFWLRHRSTKSDITRGDLSQQITKLSGKVSEHGSRLDKIEHDLEQVPTREELHAVQMQVARLDERLEALGKSTASTGAGVRRIENYLINLSKQD